jgi:hypothetical protein
MGQRQRPIRVDPERRTLRVGGEGGGRQQSERNQRACPQMFDGHFHMLPFVIPERRVSAWPGIHNVASSLRAKRSNPEAWQKNWIASSLSLLAMTK